MNPMIGLVGFADFLADFHIPITKDVLAQVKADFGEYSATIPDSYKYPGRIWARHDGAHDPRCAPKDRRWMLGRYDADPGKPGYLWINMLPIRFVKDGGIALDVLSPSLDALREAHAPTKG